MALLSNTTSCNVDLRTVLTGRRRVVKSPGTQYVTFPFGLIDITYNGSGVQVLENDYYTLAGRLIGERESGVTVFLLTDELGSVLTSISAAAGSAAVTSTQVYSPYGTPRYKRGTVPTEKGFTGQYRDGSGLDYYNARYYDPVVGRFVSADIKQGNAQGMDPYSYVGNNPETLNDPTGERFCSPATGECGHPCGGNCSPGDGGCSAHWHPPMAPCGGGGNGGPTPTKKPTSGCDPTVDSSDHCKAWAFDADKVRTKTLNDGIHHLANLEMLGSYALSILGDVINIIKGTALEKLDAILDLIILVSSNVIPLLGQTFGDSGFYQAALHFSSWMMKGLAVVQTMIGAIKSGTWWEKQGTNISVILFTSTWGGPAGAFVQGLMMLIKPAIGYLLDAGGHVLQSMALANYEEEERQKQMPLQDWCAQYGGGACSAYTPL